MPCVSPLKRMPPLSPVTLPLSAPMRSTFSSIIVPFLKGKALANYYRLQQYAMPILILVLYLLPMWTGIDVIGRYFDVTVYPLAEWLLNFAIAGI